MATVQAEKDKLDRQYQSALTNLKNRACEAAARGFEAACARSSAVFNCSIEKLHRETASGTDIFETYHDLERLRLAASTSATDAGFDWAKLRPQAEIELLGSHVHMDKIHYACLSLDGNGLAAYGNCSVQLAEPMIAHRASCFGGNSAVVFGQQHSFRSILRSNWADRHRMCIVVFAGSLTDCMEEWQFPSIIIENGARPEDDRFIEVHVFGTITARTIQAVRVNTAEFSRKQRTLFGAVQERLERFGIQVIPTG